MRKQFILIALAILLTAFGCRFSNGDGNQSISVSRNDHAYRFKASFPERKSDRIFRYVENTLHADNLISSEMDGVVKLKQGHQFQIKAASGRIEIAFDKRNNSPQSWRQLEQLCMGIKKELE